MKQNKIFIVLMMVLILMMITPSSQANFTQSLSNKDINSQPKKLNFIFNPNPPYSFKNQLRLQNMGRLIDLTEDIMSSFDNSYSITVMPVGERHKFSFKKQSNTLNIFVSTKPNTNQQNKFEWVGPIATQKIQIIGLKENEDKVKITSYKDFKKYKIGIASYDKRIHQFLLNKLVPKENINKEDIIGLNIEKLYFKELDLIIYPNKKTFWVAGQFGWKKDLFKIYFTLDEQPLYYAFPLGTNKELINKFKNKLNKNIN